MKLRTLIASFTALAGVATAQAEEIDAVVVGMPEISTITADSEVNLTGYQGRYRYTACKSSTKVNNATFTSQLSAVDPSNFSRQGMSSTYRNGDCATTVAAFETTETLTSAMQTLLGCYYGSSSVNVNSSITFRNLVVNHSYALRFWCQHSDYSTDSYQQLTLGGVTTDKVYFNTGAGLGQFVTIKFIAKSDAVKMTLSSADGTTHTQFQAFAIFEQQTYPSLTWTPEEESTVWTTTGANWSGKTADDDVWSAGTGFTQDAVIGTGATVEVQGAVSARTVTSESPIAFAAGASLTLAGPLTLTLDQNGAAIPTVLSAESVALTLKPSAATKESVTANDQSSASVEVSGARKLTLAGAGHVSADADQTVEVASGTQSFYGTLDGAMGLVKQGAGTLKLQGPNRFTGAIDIQAGTLAIGPYTDYSIQYHFDSSDTSKWTLDESEGVKKVTRLQGAAGGYPFQFNGTAGNEAKIESSADYFDGKPVLMMNANASYGVDGSKVRAMGALVVFQKNDWEGTADESNVMFTSKDSPGNDMVRFGVYAKGYQERSIWYAWSNSTSQNPNDSWRLFVDGARSPRKVVSGKRSVLSIVQAVVPSSANRADQLGYAGNSFRGAVAEVIGLKSSITLEQRNAIEAYLMQKWNCDDKLDFQMLPKTADITMAAGTTLDLGGLEQTVVSLTGAGTVQNGVLNATTVTAKGGLLTLPAVAGQSYAFAKDDNGVWGSYVFTGTATPTLIRPSGMKIVATTEGGTTTYTVRDPGLLIIVR